MSLINFEWIIVVLNLVTTETVEKRKDQNYTILKLVKFIVLNFLIHYFKTVPILILFYSFHGHIHHPFQGT
jgi:hypothetical protein